MKFSLILLALFLSGCHDSQPDSRLNVLVFSATNGYRHESISSGIKMISGCSKERHWKVTFTEDSAFFTPGNLSDVDVVVFLNTSGNVLGPAEQVIFEEFLKKGKGFVGIHSAADTEYENAFYRWMNGAYFRMHPPAQEATVIIENAEHPAMKPFRSMKTFTTFDEWYSFDEAPGDDFQVLASLDEKTILKSDNGDWKMGYHPVIWWREKDGIRSFYTVFGHTHEAFGDPVLISHYCEAIEWAGNR